MDWGESGIIERGTIVELYVVGSFYVTPLNPPLPLITPFPHFAKLTLLPTAAAADLATLYCIRRGHGETTENPRRYKRP